MRDIGDVLADLRDGDADDAHLYSTLAPVYDFAYERHFGYDDQLALVTGTVPDDADSVLEVGCGTGRLLARLEAEYGTAVGLERSEAMARRAREKTDAARVVVGDATRTRLDATFDAVVMLGRVTGHVTEDGAAERLAEHCLAHLGGAGDTGGPNPQGGVLLFDYFSTERMEDDYRTEDTFESDRYRVEREAHTMLSDGDGGPDLAETRFDYHIVDRETGESASVSETMTLRTFAADEVRNLLRDAGFTEVEVREEGPDGWPLAVARTTPEG